MRIIEAQTETELLTFKEFEQEVKSKLSIHKNFSINYRSKPFVFYSEATPKKMSFSSIFFVEYSDFSLSFSEAEIRDCSVTTTLASIAIYQYSCLFKTGEFFSITIKGNRA